MLRREHERDKRVRAADDAVSGGAGVAATDRAPLLECSGSATRSGTQRDPSLGSVVCDAQDAAFIRTDIVGQRRPIAGKHAETMAPAPRPRIDPRDGLGVAIGP